MQLLLQGLHPIEITESIKTTLAMTATNQRNTLFWKTLFYNMWNTWPKYCYMGVQLGASLQEEVTHMEKNMHIRCVQSA